MHGGCSFRRIGLAEEVNLDSLLVNILERAGALTDSPMLGQRSHAEGGAPGEIPVRIHHALEGENVAARSVGEADLFRGGVVAFESEVFGIDRRAHYPVFREFLLPELDVMASRSV